MGSVESRPIVTGSGDMGSKCITLAPAGTWISGIGRSGVVRIIIGAPCSVWGAPNTGGFATGGFNTGRSIGLDGSVLATSSSNNPVPTISMGVGRGKFSAACTSA